MTRGHPAWEGNRLLRRLPLDVGQRIAPLLQSTTLRRNQIVCEVRAPLDLVYFPVHGVLSALIVMTDGSAIEIGSIGNEGAAGVSALMGEAVSPHRIMVQVPGKCLQISARRLDSEAECRGPLRRLLLRYQLAFAAQVSQSAACNGLHPLLKRSCRWLLMAHDRLGSAEFPLTHEFLAMMLGVRRAGVTEVLQSLRDQGLIRYGRGKVTVLDRQGLEAQSCECYRQCVEQLRRLLG